MYLILLCLLAVAVASDVHSRRIPNLLVGVGIASGLLLQGIVPHPAIPSSFGSAQGVVFAITGIATGFAALFPLYLLRATGAGDVKLMMMVGAFLGPLQTLGVVVLTFAAGGVLAIAMALWQRSLHQLVFNLRFMLTTSAVRAAGGTAPRFEPLQQTAGRMPYAIAIAAGTLMQLTLIRSGGWALS
ncbi:prepilin peptidase [Aromatoleum toluclasticum]|uniref:A24 family peptidase n=1 Tax=Aromatoleum toluclasticum TaxID=92003 RepID=UPI001D193277|nr:prepilin peptidase [Aromatoleum toluclasticum]MCC4115640.1 prepilin peptidase [Aromatoleum toluclasticum]